MMVSHSKTLIALLSGLEWIYDRAVTGVPALDSASDLATFYQRRFLTDEDAVDALIKWQMAKAGTAGFVTNFGGVTSLPLTLPASLASVTYIQLRMIAAIAQIRGHDIQSDPVRTLALACLCGSRAVDVIKDFGIKFGAQIAHQVIRHVSEDSLKQLEIAICCRLLSTTGKTVPIIFAKFVPVVGGVISGGLDAAITRSYGRTAKRLFQPLTATGTVAR
jgi:uncharacterized protein (DUF697 family)